MWDIFSLCCVLQDVVLSFTARQQGNFQVCQKLDVLGFVQRGGNRTEDVTGLELCSFHTITLHLSAVCRSETIHPVPKLNPGKYWRINPIKDQNQQCVCLYFHFSTLLSAPRWFLLSFKNSSQRGSFIKKERLSDFLKQVTIIVGVGLFMEFLDRKILNITIFVFNLDDFVTHTVAALQASLQQWPIQLDHSLTLGLANWPSAVGWCVLLSSVPTKHDSMYIEGRGVRTQKGRSSWLFLMTEPQALGLPLHTDSTGRG